MSQRHGTPLIILEFHIKKNGCSNPLVSRLIISQLNSVFDNNLENITLENFSPFLSVHKVDPFRDNIKTLHGSFCICFVPASFGKIIQLF